MTVGLGIVELGLILVVLLFSLVPVAIAIWALVTISRLRGQVETLERRLATLEGPPPPGP